MRRERRSTPGLDLRFILLGIWLVLVQFGLATAPAHARTPAGAETLVVAARLGDAYLSQDLLIVRDQGRLYLPVVELGALVLIPFEPAGERRLSAMVTSTNSEILIDPDAGILIVDGVVHPLEETDVMVVEGRLFLAEEVIEAIVPVAISFDLSAMRLTLDARKPLPIEVREKQERLRERILRAQGKTAEPTGVEIPYAPFSMPVGDVNLGTAWSSDGDLQRRYDALVGAEIGYLTTQAFISGGEQRPLTELRLKAGRESPDGGAFGVDGLTEGWVGDVREPVLPLLGGGAIGRGLLVSNAPLDRPDSYDMTTIDGDALPGWDVELYQNGMLIAFQKVDLSGRYSFENVPLIYGQNIFRLVTYGPQGQLREEERKMTVGGDMVTPGETHWSVFAGQPNTRLAAPLLDMPDPGDDAGFAVEVEHGVSRNVSLGGFAARARTSPIAGSDLALSGGLVGRVSGDDMVVSADAAMQEGGGFGFSLSGIYAIDSLSLSGRYARYRNFRSVAASDGLEPLAETASVRVQRTIRRTPIGAMTLGLQGERRSYTNGQDRLAVGMDLRHRTGPFHVNHELDVGVTTYADQDFLTSSSVLYSPTVSFWRDPLMARGSARFDLASGRRLDHLAASVRYRVSDDSSLGAEVGYALSSDLGQLNLSYSRRFRFAHASASAALNTDGAVTVGLSGSFSLGMTPGGKPLVTGHRLAERGGVAPFVYHDRNADGRFESGVDTPLADVGFKLDGSRRPAVRTGVEGGAVLGEVSPSRPLTVELDEATLPDPFWVAADGPLKVQPRRSRLVAVDIPVVDSGEVSGTVTVRTAMGDLPLDGLLVQLSKANGRVLSDFRTDDHGFYLFDRLVPGRYVVTVPAGQEVEGVAIVPAGRPFELTAGGVMMDGVDILLELDGEMDGPPINDEQEFFELFGEPVAGERMD